MSSTSWGNGQVWFGRSGGESFVTFFENNGVVWYDADAGICLEGWQAELEPYEGEGWVGWSERPSKKHEKALP